MAVTIELSRCCFSSCLTIPVLYPLVLFPVELGTRISARQMQREVHIKANVWTDTGRAGRSMLHVLTDVAIITTSV